MYKLSNIKHINDHTLKIKNMPPLNDDEIKSGFNNDDLIIARKRQELENFIINNIQADTVLLFMSSGNFGGINYSEFINKINQQLP